MRQKKMRVRILYVILLILIGITVGPLWFYGSRMMSLNRERLETQESILQTITSQSLSQVISLYMENLNQQLKEFFDTAVPLATHIPAAKYSSDADLRVALEGFVADRPAVLYATVLNNQARGAQAQTRNFTEAGGPFLSRSLAAAFTAAQQGQEYRSNPITILGPGGNDVVMVMAEPILQKNQFLGMVAAVVTLRPITQALADTSGRSGLEAYVVDNAGRLVTSYDRDKFAGTDMVASPIVQKYLNWAGRARVAETSLFPLQMGNQIVMMLGTYAPTQKLGWGVIVQRKTSDAFFTVFEMRRQTFQLGLLLVVLSVVIGFLATKAITRPIDMLTQTARSIAQRDFTQRAEIRSRTEIGELASTFNQMAEDIQRYIGNLKMASEQNRQLFFDAIEMIAAAVDAKDPYTKGHSGRVAQFSVILAREIGLPEEEVDKIRISATLHDVGKIGIEDRVLKKPGVLTNEEFEIMKRHTVMGYEIVRQVKQLNEMLPGIRWHHEALNGRGYPDGVKGDELPLMVRIIAVADTFDAITTDRPYQAGAEFPKALEVLRRHVGTKYDPIVVDALDSALAKGSLAKFELRRRTVAAAPPDPVSLPHT
ncbi:MAG: HD domain-containing phosphohydrolase [Terriglobia bacterium]|jgi:HD-GYP domain-containing protein (c-di-GMP phosphodiesterase class II)